MQQSDLPRAYVYQGNLENALKRWRRIMQTSGILKQIHFREMYPNRNDRKREKAERAARRRVRNNAKHGYR